MATKHKTELMLSIGEEEVEIDVEYVYYPARSDYRDAEGCWQEGEVEEFEVESVKYGSVDLKALPFDWIDILEKHHYENVV